MKQRDDLYNWDVELERIDRTLVDRISALKAGDIHKFNRLTKRMFNYEKRIRTEANKRLRSVLKLKFGEEMGWYDKQLDFISRQFEYHTGRYAPRDKAPHFLRPLDFDSAYEQVLLELQFLSTQTSTVEGSMRVLDKIRTTTYQDFNIAEEDFVDFWRWRKSHPIQEFFNIFNPSPPELRGSVGTMVVDLWNSGEENRKLLNTYLEAYYSDRSEPTDPGSMSTGALIDRLDELYAKIGKRRRDS